jgi:hypothetical protein
MRHPERGGYLGPCSSCLDLASGAREVRGVAPVAKVAESAGVVRASVSHAVIMTQSADCHLRFYVVGRIVYSWAARSGPERPGRGEKTMTTTWNRRVEIVTRCRTERSKAPNLGMQGVLSRMEDMSLTESERDILWETFWAPSETERCS